MPAQDYLDMMQEISGSLPPTSRVRVMLDELLTMTGTGVVSYTETGGAANTIPLYRAGPVLWGAHVTFKSNDFPSFVHELTHARCILCYQADTVNYAPGGVNNVAQQFGNNPPPGAPQGTFSYVGETLRQRMLGWRRDHCKVFLDTNLNNLLGWANVTDFSTPDPYMTAREKKSVKTTLKRDPNAYFKVNYEMGALRGRVQKSGKWKGSKEINAQRLQEEMARKKNWMLERVNYGLNGQSGLGDTHNEYDTVVNQMLVQMHMWGFRKTTNETLTMLQLAQHAQAGTVPGWYLYDRIARLVEEAHNRRVANQGIGIGAPPVIIAPAAVINPPPTL